MKRLLLLSAMLMLTGCSSLSYYAQAINGQMEISRKAEPIDEVLADPATDPRVVARLRLVKQARAFASKEMGLPDNGTFQSYANLKRPFAVWNVFAAPEFSVTPVENCFPIAGCVAYRGYFSEAAAQAEGATLRGQGLDVFVAGIPVYSTLGWFNDPVLNTFIAYPEGELVGTIFHELAHQLIYVPDDTVFNESFATAVEEEGVRRWFEQAGRAGDYAAYEEMEARKQTFIDLLVRTRDRLAQVYAQPLDDSDMRQAKARVLEQARADYAVLKQGWGGYDGFDRWFADGPLNNAKLAAVALYADQVPAFNRLLARVNGDLPKFYAEVKSLARLAPDARSKQLQLLGSTQVAGYSGFDTGTGGQ